MKTKIVIIAVAALLILVIAGLVAIRLSLGVIVKTGIETIGPKVTGSKVSVSSVSFKLLKGQISIRGFVLGNPEGFTTPDAIRAKHVSVGIAPLSLLDPKIHVESIVIDGVALTCEQGLTSNNLTVIKANVDSFVRSLPGQGGSKKQETSSETTQVGGKRLQVDSVGISGITVSLAIKGVSREGAGVPVPSIQLSNLGAGPEGITPGDLAAKLLDSLLNGAIDVITPSLKDVKDILNRGAGTTVDDARKGADKLVDGAKGALDNVMGVFK